MNRLMDKSGNTNQQSAAVITLISEKINLKTKQKTINKEEHFIRGSIHQEDIIIIKIMYPNT